MPAARKRTPSTKQNLVQSGSEAPLGYISRRGILVVAGTGLAGTIIGCTTETEGSSGTGGSGGSGTGGSGTGGSGAGGSGTGGSTSIAGSGGGAGTGGSGGSGGNGTTTVADAGSTSADASSTSADAATFPDGATIEAGNPQGMVDGATSACRVTSRDQLGPYYKNGHLERAVMAGPNDGVKLVVSGRVLNTKCQPLAGAVLDVWSANGKGVYSEVGSGWCRGIVKTDSNGAYMFETVYPGPYQGRPRHLHLTIGQTGYTKVTTQMYFQGERPDIPSNAVAKVMANGGWQSEWNIVLAGGGMASDVPRIHAPETLPRRFWGAWFRPSKSA